MPVYQSLSLPQLQYGTPSAFSRLQQLYENSTASGTSDFKLINVQVSMMAVEGQFM